MTHPLDGRVETLDIFRVRLDEFGREEVCPELVTLSERDLQFNPEL